MTDNAQLHERLSLVRSKVPSNTLWKHFKGGTYLVLGHAIDTVDGSVRIRYRRVAGPNFDAVVEAKVEFVRPLSEWFEQVPDPHYENFAPAIARFVRVD